MVYIQSPGFFWHDKISLNTKPHIFNEKGGQNKEVLINRLPSVRQKTQFFSNIVLPRLVILGRIINASAVFSYHHALDENDSHLQRSPGIRTPT
ncbi:MAG: hypothetical protein L3J26_11455, partial [Candidatus Polarisedimenticolaceae bacterium]|nr:hypothetical protein [Candidatus Polarisedimenticolaceae bacterium]